MSCQTLQQAWDADPDSENGLKSTVADLVPYASTESDLPFHINKEN